MRYDINTNTLKALNVKFKLLPLLNVTDFQNLYRWMADYDDRLDIDWDSIKEIDERLRPLNMLLHKMKIEYGESNILEFTPEKKLSKVKKAV